MYNKIDIFHSLKWDAVLQMQFKVYWQVHESQGLVVDKKPTVWFISGGPGSYKGKICEYLIRDYKFKYLSSYDIIQFEQDRGGPDAQQIKKLFKNNQKMSSKLIVRLVKKAIASCGIRRFIIDGFPSSIEDINQFSRQLTERQIHFKGLIDVKISRQKMKQSGLKAHQNDKRDKKEIQRQIIETIQIFEEENSKIKRQYQKINKYIEIDGNNGPELAYQKLRQYLQFNKIQPPKPIKVFFAHFDDPKQEFELCDNLVRKYGLYYYTPKTLISEATYKNNSSESAQLKKLQSQNKQVPPKLVLSLIRKKIQKHDYSGNFLISGYPRSVSDAEEWDRQFGWQTDIKGYLTFEISDKNFQQIFEKREKQLNPKIKKNQLDQKFRSYQKNQSDIMTYYKNKDLLLMIQTRKQQQALSNIHKFFTHKNFTSRTALTQNKLLFVSTICANPSLLLPNNTHKISVAKLYEQQIQKNGLYSELIQSYLNINKSIPGFVATQLLLRQILRLKSKVNLVVEDFPNSAEQLQSWQEQVGDGIKLAGIVYYKFDEKQTQKQVQQKIKSQIITTNQWDAIQFTKRYAIQLDERLKNSDFQSLELEVSNENSYKQFEKFAKKINII